MEGFDSPLTDTATKTRPSSHQSLEIPSSTAPRALVKRKFMSYRLRGDYEKPWINDKRLKRSRMGNLIIYGFIVAGLLMSAYINYNATEQVQRHNVRGYHTA